MRKLFFLITFFSIVSTSFSQDVFDIGIRNIEIFFSEPNWDDTLDLYYANDLGERLIADSVIIDGEVDQDVGIKYKGNSSYNINNVKNPLNIKLDYIHNGQSVDRYNVLKLSNGFRDPSFVREVLSYEIAREYMPASKATYANVTVNGNLLGLYSCVQSVDDDFTNEHFYERNGPFFKVENTGISIPGCFGTLGILEYYSDTNCYQRAYEMQSANDWTKLSNFLDTLNNYFSEIENVMDIDRTLWMMAFENLTVCLDGPINSIPHNLYLFKDNNGRFSPILWDMNMAFGTFKNGLPQPVTTQDLQELDVFHGISDNQNRMTTQIFSSDQYKRMYIAHIRTILNEQFVNNAYYTRAMQLQAIINSSVNTDPNGFYSHSEFISNINSSIGSPSSIVGLTELMDPRVTYLQGLLEFTASPPTINNISSNPISVTPHSSVTISAQVSNATEVFLGYRFKFHDAFTKVTMIDNGTGLYSATINVDARDVQYYIYAENNDAGIFYPERAEKEFYQLPVVGSLVINEIMASNINAVADQNGEYDDWVELYNGSNFSLNLSGYYLSDSENNLSKWSFPNVSIPANDYMIIWCDTAGNSQSGLHTTYRLSAAQEEVYLTDPTGLVIDAVHYVNMPTDVSYARVPNGIGTFVHQSQTHNANNQNSTSITESNNVNTRLRVYPNPSNNRIYIIGAKGNLKIYNLMGKKFFLMDVDSTISVDISNWESGIYFVKSNNKVIKVIKQ